MTEALLFPEINEAALDAPSTALAPAAAVEIATRRPTVKEVVIAGFRDSEPVLRTLVARYTDVVFDVSTSSGLAQAKAARHDLRENGRFTIQRGLEATKKALNALKPLAEDEAARLIAITKPLEDAIDAKITAREEQLAAEKAERERIARERSERFQAEIAKINGYAAGARGLPSERIAKGIDFVEGLTFGDEWAEFASQAAAAQAMTLSTMRTLLAEAQAVERAAAEAEARRIEQERIAVEQAIERERLGREAAKLEAKRVELQRQADELASQRAAARSVTETIARAEVHAERVAEDLERKGYSIEIEADSPADAADRRSPTVTLFYRDSAVDGLQSIEAQELPASVDALRGTELQRQVAEMAIQRDIALPLIPQAEPEPLDTPDDAWNAVSEIAGGNGVQTFAHPTSSELTEQIARGIDLAYGSVIFAEPAPPADDAPPITVGEITRRLGFTITAAFLLMLGFEPLESKHGRGVIFRASTWPEIKAALIAHVEGLQ